MMSCFSASSRSLVKRYPPTSAELACSRSSSITCSTARAPAMTMGLPPNVLKWSLEARVWAISGVVTTAPIGRPLPIAFAIVTISGVTP